MFAPRPTKNGCVLVLLACLTGSSLASLASTVLTVYLPLTAVQVPRFTGRGGGAGSRSTPLYEPVSVFTVEPSALGRVSVMPWAPLAEATVPWFLIATREGDRSPAAGLPGVQLTEEATRSELATGLTTSGVGLV